MPAPELKPVFSKKNKIFTTDAFRAKREHKVEQSKQDLFALMPVPGIS